MRFGGMLLEVLACSGEIVSFDTAVVCCAAVVFLFNRLGHLNHGVIISVTEGTDA